MGVQGSQPFLTLRTTSCVAPGSTCAMFHEHQVIRQRGCSSLRPVLLTFCRGNCGDSASMYVSPASARRDQLVRGSVQGCTVPRRTGWRGRARRDSWGQQRALRVDGRAERGFGGRRPARCRKSACPVSRPQTQQPHWRRPGQLREGLHPTTGVRARGRQHHTPARAPLRAGARDTGVGRWGPRRLVLSRPRPQVLAGGQRGTAPL